MLKVCDMDYQRGAKFLASRDRAILLVLLDSGLRLAELSSMKLSDIDRHKSWIKVRGKGDKAPLPATAVALPATSDKAVAVRVVPQAFVMPYTPTMMMARKAAIEE